MDWGGAGGHVRTQLASLQPPQQLLVGATEALLLVALLLHVHLQVSILLRELPEEETRTSVAVFFKCRTIQGR